MEDTKLFFFDTKGFSMWPFLKGGTRLLIKKTAPNDLRRGDIICYRTESKVICHRMLKMVRKSHGNTVYVRGDNTFGAEALTEDMILGKAIAAVRNGRTTDLTTKTSQFISSLIVVVAPLSAAFVVIAKKLLRRK